LSIFVALLTEMTLYYETGYRDDLGAAPSALIVLLALLIGWALLDWPPGGFGAAAGACARSCPPGAGA
jgi:hypothetical protein